MQCLSKSRTSTASERSHEDWMHFTSLHLSIFHTLFSSKFHVVFLCCHMILTALVMPLQMCMPCKNTLEPNDIETLTLHETHTSPQCDLSKSPGKWTCCRKMEEMGDFGEVRRFLFCIVLLEVLHASLILLNLRYLSLSALFGGEGGAVWLEIFHQTTQLLYTALAVALAM